MKSIRYLSRNIDFLFTEQNCFKFPATISMSVCTFSRAIVCTLPAYDTHKTRRRWCRYCYNTQEYYVAKRQICLIIKSAAMAKVES